MDYLASRDYRCIAHDRRGHGRSSQPWNGSDMDTDADDLAKLVEALDLKDALHVGHSTGGRKYAMRYVLAKSTRYLMRMIRGLALIFGVVLVFGSPPVLARGGGHGGGHSSGHGGHHSVGHRGHHVVGHAGNNPCLASDKISENCHQLGEKQSQTIPAEKAGNRFDSRFE